MADALALLSSATLEDWECNEQPHVVYVKPSPQPVRSGSAVDVIGTLDRHLESPLTSAREFSTARTNSSYACPSRTAVPFEGDTLDGLVQDLLRGKHFTTPHRQLAAFKQLEESGAIGPVTDVVYPSLKPREVPPPASVSALKGLLGPDVAIVPADGHPNVVVLLPCHGWEEAMAQGYSVPAPTLADATLVVVEDITDASDIRVYGNDGIPFIVRCRCNNQPCLTELPPDWIVCGCNLDDPAVSHLLYTPPSSLLYSSSFGGDAETKRRLSFLATTRARQPGPGELAIALREEEERERREREQSEGRERKHAMSGHLDLTVTRALAATRGSLLDSVSTGGLASPSFSLSRSGPLTRTLSSPSPAYVNEARRALAGHITLTITSHRVWSGREAGGGGGVGEERLTFGVCEMYKGEGTVRGVKRLPVNFSPVSRHVVGTLGALSGPPPSTLSARLQRKGRGKSGRREGSPHTHAPRPLASLSLRVAASETLAPSSARSSGVEGEERGKDRGEEEEEEEEEEGGEPHQWPLEGGGGSVTLSLTATGACDPETGRGWAEYTAHDSRGRLMWRFGGSGASGEKPSLPHPHLLLPILLSLPRSSPGLGGQLEQLAHALFPSRADAMWHYIRRLTDWGEADKALHNAVEAHRLKISIPPPEGGWGDGT